MPITKISAAYLRTALRRAMLSTATEKFGLNILMRKDLLNNCEKNLLLHFGSEESIVVSEPCNASDEVPKLLKNRVGTFTLRRPFVYETLDAELVGPTSIGCDKNGNILLETILPEHYNVLDVPARTLILKYLPGLGVPQMDTVCSLVNCWGGNYFHWMVEGLTRIEGFEYYQQQTGRKSVLLIEPNPPIWKTESLKLAGYGAEDCIPWNKLRLKVKRLVVPSFRRDNYQISAAACRWVRQRVLANLPDVGSEKLSFSPKIYISRSKAIGRRVVNEAEVIEVLAPFGFVAYNLEDISFSDQVRLFSQAEVVVAPHGAGITNIIFSQNLVVIEIFGSWVVPCYFSLAKVLGFQYGCLKCKPPIPVSPETTQRSDVMVDIPKLRDLVARMQALSVAA